MASSDGSETVSLVQRVVNVIVAIFVFLIFLFHAFYKTKRPDRSRGVLRHQNMPDMHFRSTHITHNFNPRAPD